MEDQLIDGSGEKLAVEEQPLRKEFWKHTYKYTMYIIHNVALSDLEKKITQS